MGAYSYCRGCGYGLGRPTAQQIMDDEYPCPHCGVENTHCETKTELIVEMKEKIEELEFKVNGLVECVDKLLRVLSGKV